jgi:hypothetical protein
MKKFYLSFTVIGLLFCFLNLKSVAQDKSLDFAIGSNGIIYNITPCGDDNFYIVYGKMLLSKNAAKNLMKFDKDLKEVWTKPVVFTGAKVTEGIDIYSYTKPADKTTTSYVFGGEQFIQVLSDGTTKEKKTEIPEKELESVAAVFTDSIGLNIITLTGEKELATCSMNWYTYTHDQLTRKVKTIKLTLPTDIDDKNESGWRLNCVTPTGLYFYYVSYKNDTKETTRPILACNVVKVDYTGKTGDITTIDLKAEKYNIIPAIYNTNYSNLTVNLPRVFTSASSQTSTGTSHVSYFSTDNAYLGVVIDEKAKHIYTCYASNDELKVSDKGNPKTDALGRSTLMKKLNINVFDLSGSDISNSTLDFTPTTLEAHDECSYAGNSIDFYLLPGTEGLVCKAVNNSNGAVYAVNNKGTLIEKNKIELFFYKMLGNKFTSDKFSANYTSLKDFESSAYFLGTLKSPVYQYFNKLDEKMKRYVYYVSMKSGELLVQWDGKEDNLKMNFFNKK